MSWFLLSSLIGFIGLWWFKLPASTAPDRALKLGIITALWGGIGVEVTSLFSILEANALALWWTLGLLPALKFPTQRLTWTHFFWPLMGCLAVYGWQALYFPPNNYDSMTYHLPRVLTWIQQKNVAFYPTGIPRQLYINPLAEYLLTHLYLVIGDDQGVNLLQWVALVGCQIAIGLLIRHQGGNTQAQSIGMGLTLLHPMIGFQSTTTQNDLVAGFFLLASIYFTWSGERWWLLLALIAGGWVKYTVWMMYVPWGIYWIWKERTQLWKSLLVGAALACVTLGPFWARNYEKYRHPLGPTQGHADYPNVTNDLHSVATLSSNSVRTLGNNLGLPWTKWNEWIYDVYQTIHLGLRIDLQDPRTTYAQFSFQPHFGFTEDDAGSLLWLIVVGFFFLKSMLEKQHRWLWLGFVGSFLVFNFFLKYQPMHNRLLSGWIMALSIPLALGFTSWKKQTWAWGIIILLQIPIWLLNKSKPLWVPENEVRLWRNQPHNVLSKADFSKKPSYLTQFYTPIDLDSSTFVLNQNRDRALDPELVRVLIHELQVQTRPSAWMSSRELNYFQNRYAAYADVQQAVTWVKDHGCHQIDLWMGFDAMEYPIRRLILNEKPDTQFYGYQPKQKRGDCLLSMDRELPEDLSSQSQYTGTTIHIIKY